MSDHHVLAYSMAVNKPLQEETLAAAFEKLILYNEMLQVRLENGKYIPQPEDGERQASRILFHYDCTDKTADEIRAATEEIIRELSAEMRCERRESLRGAVIKVSQNSCRLLLLLHRAIADPRGVVLLCEDIYRLYEQLSNGIPLALPPVRKTYAKFIEEVGTASRENGEASLLNHPSGNNFVGLEQPDANVESDADIPKTHSLTITIGRSLKRRMFSWRLAEFELKPFEVLVGAILRSHAKASEGMEVGLNIKSNYRFVDETLNRTACALTHTYTLPPEVVKEEELLSRVQKLRGILRELYRRSQHVNSPSGSHQPHTAAPSHSLRLNLDYLTDEPWLGGDEWMPEGFIQAVDDKLSQNFSLEITPLLFSDRIEVSLKFVDVPEISSLVEGFNARLETELEAILRYCEEYVDAKEFWLREFTRDTPKTNIEVESEGRRAINRGRATMPLRVEPSVVARAETSLKTGASLVLLAAYSVLLSRLNGREDLVLVVASETNEGAKVFPFRLRPAWDTSFRQFVEEIGRKFEQAAKTCAYAFDILGEEQPKHHRAYPVLDVGYTFKQVSAQRDGDHKRGDEAPARPALVTGEVALALKVVERDAGLEIEWVYEQSRFEPELINSFGSYLKTILEDVSANADSQLGSIQISKQQSAHNVVQAIAQDAFNF